MAEEKNTTTNDKAADPNAGDEALADLTHEMGSANEHTETPYVEEGGFVPNPTDMTGTVDTVTPGQADLSQATGMVEVDKARVAQSVLDGDATVVFTEEDTSHDAEEARLKEAAEKTVERAKERKANFGAARSAEVKERNETRRATGTNANTSGNARSTARKSAAASKKS